VAFIFAPLSCFLTEMQPDPLPSRSSSKYIRPKIRRSYERVGTTTGWKSTLATSKVPNPAHDADVSKATLHVFTVGIEKYVRTKRIRVCVFQ
jgi:hypothetical protein